MWDLRGRQPNIHSIDMMAMNICALSTYLFVFINKDNKQIARYARYELSIICRQLQLATTFTIHLSIIFVFVPWLIVDLVDKCWKKHRQGYKNDHNRLWQMHSVYPIGPPASAYVSLGGSPECKINRYKIIDYQGRIKDNGKNLGFTLHYLYLTCRDKMPKNLVLSIKENFENIGVCYE